MDYFANCQTEQQRKAKYKELAKKHHPDVGGDEKVMQEINAQYKNKGINRGAQTYNTASDFYSHAFKYGYYQNTYTYTWGDDDEDIKKQEARQKAKEAKKRAKMPEIFQYDVIEDGDSRDEVFVITVRADRYEGKNTLSEYKVVMKDRVNNIYRNGNCVWDIDN